MAKPITIAFSQCYNQIHGKKQVEGRRVFLTHCLIGHSHCAWEGEVVWAGSDWSLVCPIRKQREMTAGSSVHILLGPSPVQDSSLWDGAAHSQGRTPLLS